jgi:site-specific DNA-adenine methylase
MYWQGEVKRLSTIDSLQSIIVADCNTQLVQSNNTIKSLQRNVDSLNVALSEKQKLYEREVKYKRRWRKSAVIGIPIGVAVGLLLPYLL